MLDLNRRRIILLMAKLKMNYRDLARLSGVSECTLRNIIQHGQRPRFSTVGKIAAALQSEVIEIIKEV